MFKLSVPDLYWSGDACHDAWEWVWDRFWSITMHSNGTLPLDVPLAALVDARCGYALKVFLQVKFLPRFCYYHYEMILFIVIRVTK